MGTQPRDNVPVYIDDMIKFNETILQTRKKRFFLGIQRIMLCLALMLGLFTAGRKNAILKLQYKHLRISLLRNPYDGPPILDIAIKPEYIKSFLGITNLYVKQMSAEKKIKLISWQEYVFFSRNHSGCLSCVQPACVYHGTVATRGGFQG